MYDSKNTTDTGGLTRSDSLAVAAAIADGKSPNTRRAYRRIWSDFSAWAAVQGYGVSPATDRGLAAWLVYLSYAGRSLATIRQARAGVVFAHRTAGLESPSGPHTRAALQGIGNRIGLPQRQAAPLNASGLAAIRATAHIPRRGRGGRMETEDFARRRGAVDYAIASVMRDALLRISETAVLTWADVHPAPNASGALLVKRSKTDLQGRGEFLYLGRGAMAALDVIRPAAGYPDDPIFGGLKGRQIANRIKAMCQAAGLGQGFSGHSARVGMAQDLAEAGVELPALMTAGRWRRSEMPARYIRKIALRRGAIARFYGEAD